jgi:hypothetical protein
MKWIVRLGATKKGKQFDVGLFDIEKEEEGARAWDAEARKRDYPERKLNFPNE